MASKPEPLELEDGKAEEGGAAAAEGGFSSRWAFWLSAIGCSVGFGNMWRFPFIVYEHGGLAFFVPFIIALLAVAAPIVMFEFGIGQLSGGSHPKAFGAVNRRMLYQGWTIWICAAILTYYPLLLSWSLLYFANSFKRQLPWMRTPADDAACGLLMSQASCEANPLCAWYSLPNEICEASDLNKAKMFFEVDIMAKPDYDSGFASFGGKLFAGEMISWILTFLGLVGGAKIIGYINYFIVTMPGIFLFILVGVGASLKGAGAGVKAYVGTWDSSKIATSTAWTDAVQQALFSLGAVQGSMCAYASHNDKKQNFVQDAWVVMFGDNFFAIVAGFAVFSVIGYMSHITKIPIDKLPIQGSGLVFQTYPVGIGAGLPYPANNIFSVIFFMTLWLLGMSTVIGLCEAIILPFIESRFLSRRKSIKRWHVCAAVCGVLGLFMFFYSTDMGVHFLDCTDKMLGLGYIWGTLNESVAGGWFAAYDLWVRHSGRGAVLTHMITWIGGAIVGAFLGFITPSKVGMILGPVSAVLIMIAGLVAAFMMSNKRDEDGMQLTKKQRLWGLTFWNVEKLRSLLNEPCSKWWRVPFLWSPMMKYIIPVLAAFLFFSKICDPYEMYLQPGKADDVKTPYAWYIHVIGDLVPYIIVFGLIIFAAFPSFMEFLWPVDVVEFDYDKSRRASLSEVLHTHVPGKTLSSVSSSSSSSSSSSADSTAKKDIKDAKVKR